LKKNSSKKVIVRNVGDVRSTEDVCGMVKKITTAEDLAEASIAVATIKSPTVPHYHERSAEFYYVLKGKGKILTGYQDFEIRKGTIVVIPRRIAHFTIPRETMEVIVFSAIHAWESKDQIVLGERDEDVLFSPFKERMELIDELLARNGLDYHEDGDRDENKEIEQKRRRFISQKKLDSIPIAEFRKMLSVDR
jgi:mannose-6-phosphate isomerase-like protein (cupin superfamily)